MTGSPGDASPTPIERRPAGPQRLLVGTAAYAGVGLAQRGISFLLLPFYARVLSPGDYGQVALLLVASTVATSLLTFGLDAGMLRQWYLVRDDATERTRLVNSVWLFLIAVPALVTAVCGITVGFTGWSLPDVAPRYLVLELVQVSLFVAATTVPFTIFRAEARLRDYVKVSATYALVQTAVKVVLVFGFDQGVAGWVASDVTSSVVVVPVVLLVFGQRPGRGLSTWPLRESLRIGVPLLPHQLSHWALQFADRLVLSGLLSAAAVGVYSMGYQIAAMLILVVGELNRAAIPDYGEYLADPSTGPKLASSITVQVAATVFLGLGVALVGPPLAQLILPNDYAGTAGVIPWVALGGVFVGLYYIPMNLIGIVSGDTTWVWLATVTAAAANVALNLMTVRRWELTAAAINTAAAYLILLLLVSLYHHRRVKTQLSLEWRHLVEVAAVGASGFLLGAMAGRGRAPLAALCSRGAALAIAGGLAAWLITRWRTNPATESGPPQ